MMSCSNPADNVKQQTNKIPLGLGEDVYETRRLLAELVGRTRAIMKGIEEDVKWKRARDLSAGMVLPPLRPMHEESALYADLLTLTNDFCVVLASANSAAATVDALRLTGQIEVKRAVHAADLELDPSHLYEAWMDVKMKQAGDHSLD